ncbi:MAG TPA: selenide, water dikinase SelD [Miltoncostaeaceae bacterium]|nr:selenide, water dikinase SelD [Miltoncostaeaceae bacterium]
MARLTSMARGGGCGCKLGKSALAEALALMPAPADARVLVGFDGADDGAAYRVRDDLAVVASVDFFTPIVDDPATFGAIAATNALSDLHAMGARPAFALAVAAHPADGDPGDLAAIMRGGAEAAMADGCPVLGGHTIDDPEPKYGLAAVGTAHPDRLLSNAAGRPGDVLVLTKPLGVGVITTAAMRDGCEPWAIAAATESMLASNGPAAAAAGAAGVRCATDVTGFGLLGHLAELAAASGVSARVGAAAVPLLPGARELAAAGVTTGGAARNRAFAECRVEVSPSAPDEVVELLFDPQTSGGLLLAVPPERAGALEEELGARAVAGRRVGRLGDGPPGALEVAA